MQHFKRYPAPGKGPELRRLLEENARRNAAGSIGASLSTEVASPDGPAFVNTVFFASLAGMDQYRAANAADAAWQAHVIQIQALLLQPQQTEMLRILAPYPA